MRLLYPSNFTWEDLPRFTPPAISFAPIWHGDAVEVPDDAPQAEIDALLVALRAYDRATPMVQEADASDLLVRLRASRLAGMTAEQVYVDLRAKLEAITTLAAMQAFLVETLPLMAAGIIALWHHRE